MSGDRYSGQVFSYLRRFSRKERLEGVVMLCLGAVLLFPLLCSVIVFFFQIIGYYDAVAVLLRWIAVGGGGYLFYIFPWGRFFCRFDLRRVAGRADVFLESGGRVEAATSFICKGYVCGGLEELHVKQTLALLHTLPSMRILYSRLFCLIAAAGALLFVLQITLSGEDVRQSRDMFLWLRVPIRFQTAYRKKIEAGGSFALTVKTDAAAVVVEYEHDSELYRQRAEEAAGYFVSRISRVHHKLRFRLHLRKGGSRRVSRWFPVAVVYPLEILSVRFVVRYPSYLKRKPELFRDRALLRLPYGSLVQMSGRGSAPLADCRIRGALVDRHCRVSGSRFRGRIKVSRSVSFRFRLVGVDRRTNRNPVLYRISMIKNRPPAVSLLSPSDGSTLPRSLLLPLVYDVSDETGLRSVVLRYAIHHPTWKETGRQPLPFRAEGGIGGWKWNINRLPVSPGEGISFFVYAVDRAGSAGQSKSVTVKLPTFWQMFRRADRKQDSIRRKLVDIIRKRKAAVARLERLERVQENTGESPERDLRQEFHRLLKERQRLRKELRSLAQEVKRQQSRLQAGPTLSPATVQALQQLREALKRLSLRLETGKLAIPEGTFGRAPLSPGKRKELEKRIAAQARSMLEALKRMERERVLDSVRARLRAARRLLAKNNGRPGKEGRQQARRLTREASSALKKLADRKKLPVQDLQLEKIAGKLGERGISGEINSWRPSSGATTRILRSQLRALEKRLAGLTSRGRQEAAAGTLRGLRRLTGEALFLAARFRGIVEDYHRIDKNWLRGPGPARRRMLVLLTRLGEQGRLLHSRLITLRRLTAGISFLPPPPLVWISRAGRGVEEIRKRLQNRRISGLEALFRRTGKYSEKTVLSLLRFSDRFRKSISSKGKGRVSAVTSPAAGQRQLDRRMRDFLQEMRSGKRTPGERRRLAEMAAMQRMVREALREQYGGKFLGDMEGVLREMKKIEEALKKGRLDRRLLSRERKLLKRLLRGARSMRRMGKGWRRQAERASKIGSEEQAWGIPEHLLRVRTLLRSLKGAGRLSEEGRALIRRYLHHLYRELSVERR